MTALFDLPLQRIRANGIELADKVQDSADSALVRLFPQFSEADQSTLGGAPAERDLTAPGHGP